VEGGKTSKGETKWAYERIMKARRTGATRNEKGDLPYDAGWEYLVEWKGTNVSTWEKEETLIGTGTTNETRHELAEARRESEQPFNLHERLRAEEEDTVGRGKSKNNKRQKKRGGEGSELTGEKGKLAEAIRKWTRKEEQVLPQVEEIFGIWKYLKEQVREMAEDTKKGEITETGRSNLGNIKEYTREESKSDEKDATTQYWVPFRTLYLGYDKRGTKRKEQRMALRRKL
jgi:hypothetical protein